jgi:UTP-glucose-1-phosphate uridylyltransferase
MSKIRKAVIPAAGSGSRLKPLTDYLSKPMLPLGKKPVLQHIIEELKDAGIEEVAVIVKSDNQDIEKYFKKDSAVTFIIDDSLSGPGGAILKAESFIDNDDFIVAFSDSPLKGEGLKNYIEELIVIKKDSQIAAALAIYPIPKSEVSSRGVVEWEKAPKSDSDPVRLTDIIEKPSMNIKNPWAVACRYVVDSRIFEILKSIDRDEGGELQLTPAIKQLISMDEIVLGFPLPKKLNRFDTGNFKDYFSAQKIFMNQYQ